MGVVQRAVLAVVEATTDGLAVDELVAQIYGEQPTVSQREAVRRAVRTLARDGLVERSTRWETRTRKSLKRLLDIAPCDEGLCRLCGERKKRLRMTDWHREVMRSNAHHDPGWLDDLAAAERSGFVHEVASDVRLVDERPETVDLCRRRLQIVLPVSR